MDFVDLPASDFTLKNVTVPACLMGGPGDLVQTDIAISGGNIASQSQGPQIDMKRAMVLPCFVDMHTHLDKGHIWPRAANPDGTFLGALTTVQADREANWTADDVRERMQFGLRSAWAHGTKAIRTHLDSIPPQHAISFPVFRDLRDEWAGRIELQAACLVSCEKIGGADGFPDVVQTVADSGGILGMVTYPVPDLLGRLDRFLGFASEYGLNIDFHVDETLDPDSETLRDIAQKVIETGFDAKVTVGHCCSLSTQQDARAMDTLDLVARAGIDVVSLPMCNLYLQDRGAGTPRRRGITLVHEMKDRDIPVAFASDNTRDPFYAYGDLDMVEVMRQATRIGHLDHSRSDWPASFNEIPAAAMGIEAPSLIPGAPADMILFNARSWTEFYARPQADRVVMRGGQAIERTLPSYSELDHLMERP
ncbi:MAG: cytosine deaminase [Pseudomonadota bacterium]